MRHPSPRSSKRAGAQDFPGDLPGPGVRQDPLNLKRDTAVERADVGLHQPRPVTKHKAGVVDIERRAASIGS